MYLIAEERVEVKENINSFTSVSGYSFFN